MTYATPESLAVEISKRVDARLDKEQKVKTAANAVEEISRHFQEVLEEGLAGLILKGEFKGVPLCSLEAKEGTYTYSYGGATHTVSLPTLELTLGDDAYTIAPKIEANTTSVVYAVKGRSLFFICEAVPARIMLMVNPHSGRDFTASRGMEFVGMLLNGSN